MEKKISGIDKNSFVAATTVNVTSGETKINVMILKTFSPHCGKVVDWIPMVQNRVHLQAWVPSFCKRTVLRGLLLIEVKTIVQA